MLVGIYVACHLGLQRVLWNEIYCSLGTGLVDYIRCDLKVVTLDVGDVRWSPIGDIQFFFVKHWETEMG